MPLPDAPTRVRGEHVGEVVRVARLTPHMVRVVLGGPGLAEVAELPWTDEYVKVVLPTEDGLVMRSYTVRAWDAAAREMTIDFVVHGAAGVAGPWADAVAVGDQVTLRGQGGDFFPDAACDALLVAGDESALPAIMRTLEAVPDGLATSVFVEVASLDERQDVAPRDGIHVTWVLRGETWGGALVRAVRDAHLPTGRVQAFIHGEAGVVRELRRHVRADRRVTREDLSASGYWRLGVDDEGWRASKSEWKDAVARDEAALGS
ncbi:siderophore-interacting protein [Sanguibacter sp. A247]|uniref:siderophore-interacting protein n=1 Tax=unclassified Sanguibacter TaxID=2645534 RepID=UPI003FD769F3